MILYNQLRELGASTDENTKPNCAKQLLMKLESLDKDFSPTHLDFVQDLVDEETSDLEKQNEVIDKHNEDIMSASLRLLPLFKAAPSFSDAKPDQYHTNFPASSVAWTALEDTEEDLGWWSCCIFTA